MFVSDGDVCAALSHMVPVLPEASQGGESYEKENHACINAMRGASDRCADRSFAVDPDRACRGRNGGDLRNLRHLRG